MSVDYGKYLEQHLKNVALGFYWIQNNIPEVLHEDESYEYPIVFDHDASKYDIEEYDAYDAYFYGRNKTPEVKREFNYAWLHHIHHNPHHWQHWVLINDNPDEGEIILDMPHKYIIEMICDWWAFSWKKGNLHEIFNWYDQRKAYIKLSDATRKTVEDILEKIKEKLSEDEDI